MRITTQTYVLVNNARKPLEFTGPDGAAREVRVDIDLLECDICGALLPDAAAVRHARWHRELDGSTDHQR